ncbi:MAG: hypothetical protein GF411_19660 [Candidatus Lokiarchaeota archaeon]|nr:hypothetical protein [Candidatus Lokiarchaeota archaeon]
MKLVFKCPACDGSALIEMTDEEAAEVKERISKEGRSPTMIVRCENNHELLVTLYNQRGGKGLGVRDVVVPMQKEKKKESKTGSSELDWLTDAFG